ncbi:hypothetical protein [Aporhodopirellula aestuarii]|uniref:Tetratricopeptide repeat protein n=1 Tax=Aporhodopirellula aestuarii TaxID=2950107 RepID=A0ABT0UBD1_9BACT|nr:hypothetical protein [Aporhodopirellula aestuarii]MCM2374220.1 hypothetical protein [Aporhodopirellula aestuarii]
MKLRFNLILNLVVGLVAIAATAPATTVQAQSAILSEIYGRGVHAYNAGRYDKASEWLSMAITNGFQDPRAYYFRGLAAAASGRAQEAKTDFQQGAEIEARGAFGDIVGRSLARIQGPTRIELEDAREAARLKALALGVSRSQARYGELGVPAAGAAPNNATAATPRKVMPPAAPPVDDPFADDMGGDPVVESNDMLEGAMDNSILGDDGGAATPEPTESSNPFDSGPSDDPFGGGGAMDDPFGGF